MKQRTFAAASLLLILCLLAALCACGTEDSRTPSLPETVPTTAAPTEAPPPEAAEERLELDGTLLGQLYQAEDGLCLRADDLAPLPELSLTEPETGVLALRWGETAFRFRDGSDQAEAADGSGQPLGTAVRQAEGAWYLPLSALELWGRRAVFDPEEALYRYLSLESGPELFFNGERMGTGLLWGGVPVLEAATFADLAEGSAEAVTSPEGTPCLELRLRERVLCLKAGSSRAELDGEALELQVPSWQEAQNWYLPVEAAEALDCIVTEDAELQRLSLWQTEEGPALWFDGRGLGKTLCVNEVPCAALGDLAEAAGAELEQTEAGLSLTLGDRVLLLAPGSAEAVADGEALELPAPVLPYGEDWLAPVAPLAEALGLPRSEGDALSFSRMEARDTLLWIDGREVSAFALPEGPLCFELSGLISAGETPAAEGNTLLLTAFGRTLVLEGGSSSVLVDEEPVKLSAPVYADGERWYAPASELLPALGLSELEDPKLDQIYYTHIVRHDDLAEGYRVPVLMYHAVSDYVWGIPELFVSPSKLEQQIQALVEGGYTAITFEDLDHIADIEKPVMLTFDDGYDDNYTELFPLLKQYNVKATVFVIVDDLGKNHKLTKAQVKEMSDSGLVSIQSHTMSHNYLDWMYEQQLRHEHYDSMIELARITGKQPFVMCYPTGKNSYYSRSITAEYYEYGLCMTGPCWVTGEAP